VTYISADELKKHWGILDFELLKFIRDGLPTYDLIGRSTITDSEVAYVKDETIDEFRKRLFLIEIKHESERIEKNNSAEYAINADRLIKAGLLDSELPPPEMYDDKKVRQRVEARIVEEYDRLPTFPVVPNDRRLIPDALNESDLHTLLDEIKTFQFKIPEINQFAKLHELKLIEENKFPHEDETMTQPPMIVESCVPKKKCCTPGKEEDRKSEADAFIRSLKVFFKDNTEVTIQYDGKRKNYTCESIGFRDSNTKAWKTFLEILQESEHVYSLGPAHIINKEIQQKTRIKEYDSRLKLLQEIDEKLKAFLSEKYKIKFPPDFKLYEPQPAKGAGVYSFKFQIPSSKQSYKTKDQALKRLKTLAQGGVLSEKINEAVETAMEAGANKDEVFKITKDLSPSQPEYCVTKNESDNDDEDKELD
jgi:hypothetical protein